jgi:5'-methylthioadenosine phosphorylase
LNDLVIVDDFIDMKPNHPQSILPYFFKGKPRDQWPTGGTRMFPVMCPILRRGMYDQASRIHFAKVKLGGTLMQTRSARWETPAEIRAWRLLGADVTCTLDATSIVYAKQAGIHFATGQYVMNFGEGTRPMEAATTSEDGFNRLAVSMRKTLLETLTVVPTGAPKCDCFRGRL